MKLRIFAFVLIPLGTQWLIADTRKKCLDDANAAWDRCYRDADAWGASMNAQADQRYAICTDPLSQDTGGIAQCYRAVYDRCGYENESCYTPGLESCRAEFLGVPGDGVGECKRRQLSSYATNAQGVENLKSVTSGSYVCCNDQRSNTINNCPAAGLCNLDSD